jgi:hypothetical protein
MSPFQKSEEYHMADMWPSKAREMRTFRNVGQVLLDLASEAEKVAQNTSWPAIALERFKAAQVFRELAAKLPARIGD